MNIKYTSKICFFVLSSWPFPFEEGRGTSQRAFIVTHWKCLDCVFYYAAYSILLFFITAPPGKPCPLGGLLQVWDCCASLVAQMVKKLPANAGDVKDAGLIPGSGRSPGGGHGNPLQYSCLGNLMDKEAWRVTVHRVTKSWTQLSD